MSGVIDASVGVGHLPAHSTAALVRSLEAVARGEATTDADLIDRRCSAELGRRIGRTFSHRDRDAMADARCARRNELRAAGVHEVDMGPDLARVTLTAYGEMTARYWMEAQ